MVNPGSGGEVMGSEPFGVFLSRRAFSQLPGDSEATPVQAVVDGPIGLGVFRGHVGGRLGGLLVGPQPVVFHAVAGAPAFPPAHSWVPVLVEGGEGLVSAEAARLMELLPAAGYLASEVDDLTLLMEATGETDVYSADSLSTPRIFVSSVRAMELVETEAGVLLIPLVEAGSRWGRGRSRVDGPCRRRRSVSTKRRLRGTRSCEWARGMRRRWWWNRRCGGPGSVWRRRRCMR